MESKKSIGWLPFGLIAVVVGVGLFKQIDFEHLNVKEPALATIYLLTFIFSVFAIVKGIRQTSNKAKGDDEL